MRTLGLIALAMFFPVFARADSPPMLITYTVSNSTIYPAATESGFATTTSIDTAFSEQVKVSIKIISANGSMVKALYSSSSVTNPTPKTWDGLNTADTQVDNGTYTILISATSTATGLAMSDSSKTITLASSSSSPSGSPEPVTTTVVTGGASPEYIPIPMLSVVAGGDRTVSSGADTPFTAIVYDSKGNRRNDALVTWTFGDGMRKTGASVFHTYYESGEYLAIVRATTSDGGSVMLNMVVTVKDAGIKITSISARGITLENNSSRAVDLSLWWLSMGGKEFQIPADTHVLANNTLLFSSRVIELPVAEAALLLYPNKDVAAAYPEAQKPISSMVGSNVQAELPLAVYKETAPVVTKQTIQEHEEAVIAPTVAPNEVAAVGAVSGLPKESAVSFPQTPSPVESTGAQRFFRSAWAYSFLGVVALAGSVFIFL